MRTSSLSLFSLAAAAASPALAANNNTYAKTDNDDWFLTFNVQGYHSGEETYTLCLYNTSEWASPLVINNKTELYFYDVETYFDATIGLNTTLESSTVRELEFTIFHEAIMEKRDMGGTPAPGFRSSRIGCRVHCKGPLLGYSTNQGFAIILRRSYFQQVCV
ncbi:hypothetical protein BGW36DRAFT_442051 [Talaromyces proteolyticus]|uniref:Uncharacterized protein n=1 Tax=Talaromyces proteolyticus TaxID=1131652 RepID=A0AAD4KE77_9EURO|nr:uncharacterized protein BGW36DRAFT_442051 [Talaromyces proteolyticus]KAH8688950.1 hypothetical protein BGW36DRAFT_442051 [Talaromyces proteolyticus]